MAIELPSPPELGEPCPVTASPATLSLLAHRRSSAAAGLTAPGPDADEVSALLRLATRVPDHGKLTPWRLRVLRSEDKAPILEALRDVAARQPSPDKAAAALLKLSAPPVTVMVVSAPKPASIPAWEQELSAGALCMTLLIAAEAAGFGANWITDWYSYDTQATALFGVGPNERIAGFIHLGAPASDPLERARPDLEAVLTPAPTV